MDPDEKETSEVVWRSPGVLNPLSFLANILKFILCF